jgi:hypothetical protein
MPMYHRTQVFLFTVLGIVEIAVCLAENRCSAVGSARASPSPTIHAARAAIDVQCDGLVPVTKQRAGRIFGLTPGAGASWREYADSKELEKAIGKSEILQKARVWRGKDGLTAIQMVENPISGDWSQAVDYCFRSDGSLARLESTLVTFDTSDDIEEGVERLRVLYFNPKGQEVARREEVKNAKSRQPAKRVFVDKTETIYRTIRDIPFAALLGK